MSNLVEDFLAALTRTMNGDPYPAPPAKYRPIRYRVIALRDPLHNSLLAGRYRIVSRLGKGAMAIVYKAIQEPIDRVVAIKILNHSFINDQYAVKRFRLEAKTLSALRHKNILSVHDLGNTEAGQPFFVMEYLDGISLERLIENRGPVPVARAVPIFAQICDGLSYAHNEGVIHRDLKPANVMLVAEENSDEIVKLVDFGIVKVSRKSQLLSQQLTRQGEIWGSPIYMSPEQCMGTSLDARSDIYSLGLLMYETLLGVSAVSGNNIAQIVTAQMSKMPMSFKEAVPALRIPEALENIVFRALAKKPEDRFRSMAEVRSELEAFSGPYGIKLRKTTGVISQSNRAIPGTMDGADEIFTPEPHKLGGASPPGSHVSSGSPQNAPPGAKPQAYPPTGKPQGVPPGAKPQGVPPGAKPHAYPPGTKPQNYPTGEKTQQPPSGTKPLAKPEGNQSGGRQQNNAPDAIPHNGPSARSEHGALHNQSVAPQEASAARNTNSVDPSLAAKTGFDRDQEIAEQRKRELDQMDAGTVYSGDSRAGSHFQADPKYTSTNPKIEAAKHKHEMDSMLAILVGLGLLVLGAAVGLQLFGGKAKFPLVPPRYQHSNSLKGSGAKGNILNGNKGTTGAKVDESKSKLDDSQKNKNGLEDVKTDTSVNDQTSGPGGTVSGTDTASSGPSDIDPSLNSQPVQSNDRHHGSSSPSNDSQDQINIRTGEPLNPSQSKPKEHKIGSAHSEQKHTEQIITEKNLLKKQKQDNVGDIQINSPTHHGDWKKQITNLVDNEGKKPTSKHKKASPASDNSEEFLESIHLKRHHTDSTQQWLDVQEREHE